MSNGKLIGPQAFDYTVFRINPGLTTCKDLATVVDKGMDNN